MMTGGLAAGSLRGWHPPGNADGYLRSSSPPPGPTTARTGLKVRARLDEGTCPGGAKITGRQTRELEKTRLTRDPWHGAWNYSLHPPATPDDHDAPAEDLDAS